MISHLLLDVDGVIVGSQIGKNSPLPNESVNNALRETRERGVSVSFCTGKPLFSLQHVINSVGIGGRHISDGGAQVYDADTQELVASFPMAPALLLRLVNAYSALKAHVEFYSQDNYFIRWRDVSPASDQHWRVLDQPPQVVDSAERLIAETPIVKLVVIAHDETEQAPIEKVFAPFRGEAHLYWGTHPSILPLRFAVLTDIAVSKETAAVTLSQSLPGGFAETLGAGDETGDWSFIQHCQHKVAMGNATPELKALVSTSPGGFIAPSVDEDGIIAALKHFELVS